MVSDERAALAGTRVIELAGPLGEWCGKLFADMGADVIKVEPPGGADTRSIGPFVDDVPHRERSLYFWHHNTSKRSITLNVQSEEGRALLRRLIAGADVFLETLPPGETRRLGFDYATLEALNPRLVMVSITPFGQDGPYSHFQATDLVLMAVGGPMQSCGYDPEEGDLPPVRPGPYHSFYTASHYAFIGALAALWEREASGRGQHLDVSAQACLAVTVEFANLQWVYQERPLRRQTGRHAGLQRTAPTQYRCADGNYINLALPRDDATWQRLLDYLHSRGLGLELSDELLRDPARRFERGGLVMSVLEVLCATHTAEELCRLGQSMGLTWGEVRPPEKWLGDPHAEARGFFQQVEHPELGRTVTYPGAPYLFSESPWAIRRRPPLPGEHNLEVYAELGLDKLALSALAEAGVI